MYVACIFVDLKRAFDTVDRKRLERKIRRIGLSEPASKLILSYLECRQTATNIGNTTSNLKRILVGVAQGSIIGPLLFIMYMNDILQLDFLGKILLYADDTVLYYAADSPIALEQMMQKDVRLLHKWLNQNVLTLNTGKTCYMTFGRASSLPDFDIRIDGDSIKRVRSYKYLGLFLDENLTFDLHIDHVKKMIRPFVPLMWRRGKYIPVEKRKLLYNAYVQTHIINMLPIYSQGYKTKLNELQILQNRCVKAAFRLPRTTPTTYLYGSTLLPIHQLAIVERITHLHRMVKSTTKHGFDICINGEAHDRVMRRRSHIHRLNHHPSLHQSINEYNRLSSELRQSNCIKTFKAKVSIKIMDESEQFCAISPFVFIN